jgi:prophage antirepressor-like protein
MQSPQNARELVKIYFNHREIRVYTLDNLIHVFCFDDLLAALETPLSITDFSENEIVTIAIPHQSQYITTITENGLILMDEPNNTIHTFCKWIISDVLPKIRIGSIFAIKPFKSKCYNEDKHEYKIRYKELTNRNLELQIELERIKK